jgi:hypothetical protein
MQYVGETGQSLKQRFRSHSYKIRNNRKYHNFLYHHFKRYPLHSIKHVTLQPVQMLIKLPSATHKDNKIARLQAEFEWIVKLRSAFPLGLNDQIYRKGNISNDPNINIFSLGTKRVRRRRSHGKRRNGNIRRRDRLDRSLDDILTIASNNGKHELLTALSASSVSNLKSILDDANNRQFRETNNDNVKIIVAFAYNKLYPIIDKQSDKIKTFMKIQFANKGIDLLNISNIFRDYKVTSKIPQYFKHLEPPLLCYKYNKPTRNLFFNYNEITCNLDLLDNIPNSCDCVGSKYLYKPVGHIVTGDLSIIKDSKLRKLVSKGPKYRLPSKVDFKRCRNVILESIDSYIKQWSKREGALQLALREWKDAFLDILDTRIKNFISNPHLVHEPKVYKVNHIKRKLEIIHKQYVLAPADKAANNIIFV